MYSGHKILALITARGGSKGIPRKNVIDVAGKPLIGWTIEAARHSTLLDRLVLSSDDAEIISVAAQLGCEVPFVRDLSLAGDAASSVDVVIDCLQRLPEYDYIVLLQPTSPLRTAEDIDEAVRLCIDAQAPACVSVCEVEESPFWMFSLSDNGVLDPLLKSQYSRRQELPSIYRLNGAVYVAKTSWFIESRSFLSELTQGYIMPRERSLDIDTPDDLEKVRHFMAITP
ncbi:cytidylyltransferase domain-containing protein [Pseudomonas sp. NPDC089554]|uniref:acylneuraminate cytidylyltransferase family protein n=1 Tax=Pseudomonas sp. NPDC089554 TaxID=3390653 RepID=UPI003CFDEA96